VAPLARLGDVLAESHGVGGGWRLDGVGGLVVDEERGGVADIGRHHEREHRPEPHGLHRAVDRREAVDVGDHVRELVVGQVRKLEGGHGRSPTVAAHAVAHRVVFAARTGWSERNAAFRSTNVFGSNSCTAVHRWEPTPETVLYDVDHSDAIPV